MVGLDEADVLPKIEGDEDGGRGILKLIVRHRGDIVAQPVNIPLTDSFASGIATGWAALLSLYALLNLSLLCLQRGHFQSAGKSSKAVPAGMPCSGSPMAGS